VSLKTNPKAVAGELAVPGSTANLGGGFDTLGLALQVYLRAHIIDVNDDGAATLTVTSSTPPVRGQNAVERAFHAIARQTGRRTPSVSAEIISDIPMAAGLGSSAAATVAGLRIFERVTGPVPEGLMLQVAASLEGHADNAAPAIHGGLTSVVDVEAGEPHVLRWHWPDDLRVIVATPSVGLATAKARAALADTVSRKDAIFNLQRVLSLVHALQHGDYDRLREAVRDRWHQPARAALVPQMDAVLTLDDRDILGAFLSGAGPSMAVLARRDFARLEQRLTSMYEQAGCAVTVRTLAVHQSTEAAAGELAAAHGRTV
jgi:homoserine kinase